MIPLHPLLQRAFRKLKKLLSNPPEDPTDYALVGAPVVPKPPTLAAKAAAVPERYQVD